PAPVSKEPPPRTSATDAHPDNPNASATTNLASAPTSAGVRTASFNIKSPTASSPSQVAPGAAAAGTATASTADPNNPAVTTLHEANVSSAGDANAGPPPALDLGSMQSAPDLAATSLDEEIKKADTPARMAALRVTEQARVELQAGHTDEAIRDLGRAVSIDPGNPFEYFYLGRAYIARRNYHQALTFLERAEIGFAARPDWLGADVGLEGDCYEELGQNTDAVLAYRRALGTAPNNLTARVGYSRLASYLPAPPSPPSVDASADPASADEVSPPPRADATVPAPSEPPPPPPPVSNVQQSAPKEVAPADSSQD
ncbi:MAG TPA: tetratricopeptide repeat protein, partial [Candidatus Binataceae bacterium]